MVVLRALRTELRRNRTRGNTPFGPRWATSARIEVGRDTSEDPGGAEVGVLGSSGVVAARAPTSKDRAEGYLTRALGLSYFFQFSGTWSWCFVQAEKLRKIEKSNYITAGLTFLLTAGWSTGSHRNHPHRTHGGWDEAKRAREWDS